jgi:hypothetical protein
VTADYVFLSITAAISGFWKAAMFAIACDANYIKLFCILTTAPQHQTLGVWLSAHLDVSLVLSRLDYGNASLADYRRFISADQSQYLTPPPDRYVAPPGASTLPRLLVISIG